jgi:hypothetical protein
MSKAVRSTAKSIGTNDANTATLAAEIRAVWVKAKPEAQAEIAFEFKVGYISGRDRLSISDAQAIVEAGKGADAINAPAIVRAVAAWNYHIVSKLDAKPVAPAAHKRVNKADRAMAMDFLAQFDGESLQEQIKHAIALLNALK